MYKYYFIFILPGTSIINIICILLSDKYKFLNILYGHMIEFFFNVAHFDCICFKTVLLQNIGQLAWEQISPTQIYLQCK
jgi:hypothetical protein